MLHHHFPGLMVLRLKFFYIQLEENAQVTLSFLRGEFAELYVGLGSGRGGRANGNPQAAERMIRLESMDAWKSPFGSEVAYIDRLDPSELSLELNVLRKRIHEYQSLYCVYSKCLGKVNKVKSSGDVG